MPTQRRPITLWLAMFISFWAAFSGQKATAQTLPQQLTLTNITIQGQPRTLVLYKRPVRSTNFFYLTWTSANGYATNTPPQVRTFRGRVGESTNTLVCAIIKPGGILRADGFDYELGKSYTWSIDNVNVAAQLPVGSYAPAGAQVAQPTAETGGTPLDPEGPCGCPECNGELPPPSLNKATALYGSIPRSTYMPPSGGMQQMDLGIDITHYRYQQSYGGNADLALANIEHTVNIYDLMMARDALISIRETVVVVREDIFYVPTGMGNQLNLMTTAWKTEPLASMPWDQIHSFATEQGLFGAGGYAWGNNIGKDESPANVEALYHEAGHNWDVVHIVYGADTMGGNRPNHGPFSIDRLLRKRSESMTEGDLVPYPGTYPDPLPPYTHVDCASVLTNSYVDIPVLTNDWDGNGDALTVVAFSTNTTKGATVSWVSNGVLRYTPAPNYVGKDLFAYTVRDATGLKTRDLVHVEVVNRSLGAWYPFDEMAGKTAGDASGNGHPGKLQGLTDFGTSAEPGVSGQALRVDSGGVICDASPLLPPDAPPVGDYNYWPFDSDSMGIGNFFDPMDESCSIAFWFKTYDLSTTRSLIHKERHSENKVGFNLTMSAGGLTATVREFNGLSNVKTLSWSTALAAARWYHVVLQFDRAAGLARLFVDGTQRATAALDAGRFIFQGRQPLVVGREAGGQVVFDEFRFYTKALSTTEIQALYAVGHIAASGPSPADGERDVALAPLLTWVAGRTNYQHDLFFGTNLANIIAATTNTTEYRGRLAQARYTPESLLPGITYYWRVDEVLGGTNVAGGEVWSFVTAPDAIHGGLKLQLTLDERDTINNVTYDRAGPPFNDGTLYGGPVSGPGQAGQALTFNGTDQYVDVPALKVTTDTMTLLAWVRRDGTAADYAGLLFHRGTSASGMNVSTLNRLGYHWNNAANTYNFNSGLTLPDGQWALAAVVIETNRAVVYLGLPTGVLSAATNNVSHGLCTFDASLRLASDSAGSTRFFRGGMDEVGVWTRALSRAEIGLILTNGINGGGLDGGLAVPQPGTYTWTGNTDALWSSAGNWSANAVPGNSSTVIFDESSARNLNTDLAQAQSVGGVLIAGKLRGLRIGSSSGGALTLNSGGLRLSNSFTSLAMDAPVNLAAAQSWTVSEFAGLNLNSNLVNAGFALTLTNDGPVTVGGVISGTGGLVKRGKGLLAINRGGQAFTGGLTVGGGRLQALGGGWATSLFANVTPRSITVQSNATLETTTHSLGGLGGSFYQPIITLNEGATWQLNAEQYLSGGNLVLKGATVSILANDLRIQGGTVLVNPSTIPTLINGGGSITLYGDTTFNVGNGSLATDAAISVPIGNSGNRAVIKSGTGTLALTEPCSFYGPTTVSAGALALRGGKDTLSQSMNASISAGAVLDLSNNDQTLASLTGAGNVQLGYGTLTVTLSSTQTYSGVISGSPVGVPVGSGNTEESPNPGGFTKAGTGKLILTGSHTYTGDTIISSGVLALSGSGSMAYSSNIFVAGILDVTARTGGSMGLANFQTLRGNGTVLGTVSAGTGSRLAPGDSVGTLTTGSQVWSGGAVLECEFTHATSPGSWDRLLINGSLNVSSSSANRFLIRLVSPGGPLAGFNPGTSYSWVIATTTGGIINFAPDKLAVDASGLGVNPAGGRFSVQSQGNNLVLLFTPYVPTVITGFSMANGVFSLSGTGMVSQTYVLQATTNLTSPVVWTPLATNSADPSGNFGFVDPTATNSSSRFYRVTLP